MQIQIRETKSIRIHVELGSYTKHQPLVLYLHIEEVSTNQAAAVAEPYHRPKLHLRQEFT
jgi:hypothetical protein